MNLVKLDGFPQLRESVNHFGGLSLLEAPLEGEIAADENMSDNLYPFLTVGGERMLLSELHGECLGLHSKNMPLAVLSVGEGESAAARLYYAGEETPLALTYGKKQMVSMGTKVVIFPDNAYYDTYDGSCGSLEAFFETEEGVTVKFSLARADASDYLAEYSPTAPLSPSDGAYWCDTSVYPSVLRVYSEAAASWSGVDAVYVKISYPSIGENFNVGDGVTVSGSEVASLNGATVISGKDTDYVIVPGILTGDVTQQAPLSLSRRVPAMDFVTECANRLWGCRYGLDNNGSFVNEIYASKLGDPFNWQCYEGISTDSYAASVGTDGAFTGAVSYLGSVLFFKEEHLHKVLGTKPSNFQITSNIMRGVEKGSAESLCILGEVLYYRSRGGIMAYDGAFPQCASAKLGDIYMKNVICGKSILNLYFSFEDEKGVRQLFSYNPSKGIWHRFSPAEVTAFICFEGVPLFTEGQRLFALDPMDTQRERLSSLFGCENKTQLPASWYFETSELVPRDGKSFAVQSVQIKMKGHRGSAVRVRMKVDGGEWRPVASLKCPITNLITIPVATGRCQSLRLSLSGTGKVTVFSIGRTLVEAPDSLGGVY